jgi:polar amino acid transport system substrate-binding protein
MLLCLCIVGLHAQSLTIYTENNPPLQFAGTDGKPTGLSVEVVEELQKRVGNSDSIAIVPWARGYKEIQSQPNIVLFSTGRTAERNPLFQWVGPIFENQYAFFSKNDSQLKITSLDDAKKVGHIGVVLNDVRDQYLKSKGFTNLDEGDDYATQFKKLMLGRIDCAVSSVSNVDSLVKQAGGSMANIKAQYVFLKAQLWITFSKSTNPAVVSKWQAAFDEMEKDGTYEKIFKKYFPAGTASMPGPAITTF